MGGLIFYGILSTFTVGKIVYIPEENGETVKQMEPDKMYKIYYIILGLVISLFGIWMIMFSILTRNINFADKIWYFYFMFIIIVMIIVAIVIVVYESLYNEINYLTNELNNAVNQSNTSSS